MTHGEILVAAIGAVGAMASVVVAWMLSRISDSTAAALRDLTYRVSNIERALIARALMAHPQGE